MHLANRKVVGKATAIRRLLDTSNDPLEISLDENGIRFAMHPADQYERFRDLAEQKGWDSDQIGVRFGASTAVVCQRLRPAAVSPVLIDAFAAEELTLDQMMAFAVSEDHARQEQVLEALSFNRFLSHIRRAVTEEEVEAGDRRALFIGAEAYEAAGAALTRSAMPTRAYRRAVTKWAADIAARPRLSGR